jgi:hypothetical protein
MQVMRQLTDAGFVVVGPAVSAARALALIIREGCDAAVLDIRLGSETSEPVAQELLLRGVPFVGMTGYTREQQPSIFQTAPMLAKPVRMDELIELLWRCLPRSGDPSV